MLFESPVQRYVVPVGTSYPVDSDGIRSGSPWTALPGQRAVSTVGKRASLALLGEPGIGKSTTLRQLVVGDPFVTYVELDEASDAQTLQHLLAPALASPVGQPATLILDGVDECPLAPKTLVRRISYAVKGRANIRVLVGCRAADWPASLGQALQDALGEFPVLELLPLSAKDIATIAEERSADGQAFLSAVRGAAAGPLATLPLSLDLLLNVYVEKGSLPGNPRDLYERGLLLLAGEPDPDRATEATPAGTDAQRLSVASRVAGILMLCGRSAVALQGPAAEADIPAGEFAAGTERLSAGEFAVTAELLHGALATAIFSSRGPGRLGVSHASFGAFLTARYLNSHQIPEHQLRALLTRTSSLGHTSVPSRLRETAAWLVACDPERNRWLVDVDPNAFIAHGAVLNDANLRAVLVAHLLDDTDPNGPRGQQLAALSHPGLADQLRPALRLPLVEDAGPHFGNPISRRAQIAMQIARRSGLRDVSDEIADIAACPELNPYLRSSAAHALADLDPDRAVLALRDLLDEVLEHPDRDPEDDLRGIALETCWPVALTVDELLPALKAPQRQNYIGSYQVFLGQFTDKLDEEQVEELVCAVASPRPTAGQTGDEQQWCDEDEIDPASFLFTGTRRGARLMTGLLERSLQSPRLAHFVDAAGQLVAECMKQHERASLPLRFARIDGDENMNELRHSLALAALDHMAPARAGLLVWNWHVAVADEPQPSTQSVRRGLIGQDDLGWLFTLNDGLHAEHAARLIRAVYNPIDRQHQDVAAEHWEHPLLAQSIGHWFEPVELNSAVAKDMREAHELSAPRAWPGRETHRQALTDAWTRCTSGDVTAFGELCQRLRTDPETGSASHFSDDISSWPSFPLLGADPDTIADIARAYIAATDPSSGDWLQKPGSITYMALDGYAGLSLLARRPDADGWLDSLPSDVWVRWAPAVIRSPTEPDDTSRAIRDRLLVEVSRRVPSDFAAAYTSWIVQAVEAGWSLPDLNPLAPEYDANIGDQLFVLVPPLIDTINRARSEIGELRHLDAGDATADATRTQLMGRLSRCRSDVATLGEFLGARGHEHTIAALESVLGTPAKPGLDVADARAAAAAALLSAGRLAWSKLIHFMLVDDEFGRSAVSGLARAANDGSPLRTLDESELGQLWTWLNERWSSDTDSFSSGFVSDDEQARHWRDGVMRELSSRATATATAVLSQLLAENPTDYRLKTALHEAEARERDESWQGPTLAEFIALVDDSRRTVVHGDDDLFRLVLSLLDRFAIRLHSVGYLLWNESRSTNGKGKEWRPKYEPDVSALLKDHLEQEFADHLVVNREVLVRQTTSKGHGLSVDVLASGGSPAHGERQPQCPIEVKGSWNNGLLTDLQAQLVDDYLPALHATRGVYVCAWFPVEQWTDNRDSRRSTAATREREATARELEEAALAASSGGVEVLAVVVDVPRPVPSARAQPRAVDT